MMILIGRIVALEWSCVVVDTLRSTSSVRCCEVKLEEESYKEGRRQRLKRRPRYRYPRRPPPGQGE